MYDALTKFQQKSYKDKCFQKTIQKSENKRKERDIRKSHIPNNLVNLKKLIQRMSLSIKEEEQLSETVKEFPVLYKKAAKGYNQSNQSIKHYIFHCP